MDLKRCYIVDIDGTLADLSHRLHYIQKKPKDWDGFFDAVHLDTPIPHMCGLVGRLFLGAYVVFASGRPERTRVATEAWLRKHVFLPPLGPTVLYMRPDGDRRDDTIVKQEMLGRMLADRWQPVMAFDDRDRVVEMWRANGIPCAQVAKGDF